MIIWYKNSLLASIISVLGCAGIIAAVSELMTDEAIRELSAPEAVGIIAVGIIMVILGKIISVNKENKTNAAPSRRPVPTQDTETVKGGASRPAQTAQVQSANMISCPYCHQTNTADSQFCCNCGQRIVR